MKTALMKPDATKDELAALNERYRGRRVRVKKNQRRLGGDKYPGRFGFIEKVHPFTEPELLIYVSLEKTNRAKERVDTFWLRDLIILDEDDEQ